MPRPDRELPLLSAGIRPQLGIPNMASNMVALCWYPTPACYPIWLHSNMVALCWYPLWHPQYGIQYGCTLLVSDPSLASPIWRLRFADHGKCRDTISGEVVRTNEQLRILTASPRVSNLRCIEIFWDESWQKWIDAFRGQWVLREIHTD